MSEEIPIHSNLDLTIFICEVIGMLKNGENNKKITIQGIDKEIRKVEENEFTDEDLIV